MNTAQEFPALHKLRLGLEQLEALKTQGFVAREQRGEKCFYKLRFRLHQKQIVRYLGGSAELAAQVASELQELQSAKRSLAELKRGAREVRTVLRQSKKVLAPILLPLGFHFYGRELRLRRLGVGRNQKLARLDAEHQLLTVKDAPR